jgi:ADP-ribose diphosphatase
VSIPNIPIPNVKEKKVVFRDFFELHAETLQLGSEAEKCYFSFHLPTNAVCVLAKTKEDKWISIFEYRFPAKEWLLSCPGGRIDPGEDPLTAAQRELVEETGYGGGTWKLLGNLYPFPGLTNQKIFIFSAKGVEKQQTPRLEAYECIHLMLKTDEELKQAICTSSHVDSTLCSALYLYGQSG